MANSTLSKMQFAGLICGKIELNFGKNKTSLWHRLAKIIFGK
jgi:hypothetical protein